MTQQKGFTSTIMIGWEDVAYNTVATTGFVLPVISCKIAPGQNAIQSKELRANGNPSEPMPGRKDVSIDISVALDSVACWYWAKAAFGTVATTGSGPYVHEFKITPALPSFSLEVSATDFDTDNYERVTGCKVNTISTSTTDEGEIVLQINALGSTYTEDLTSPFDAAPTTVTSAKVSALDVASGAFLEGGSELATATAFSVSLGNNLDGDTYVIGGGGVRGSINEGVRSVTGSVTALYTGPTLLSKAMDRTETSLKWTATAAATSVVEFEVQEMKYSPSSPAIDGPQGRKVDMSFEGYYTDGSEASALVLRLTNSEAHA